MTHHTGAAEMKVLCPARLLTSRTLAMGLREGELTSITGMASEFDASKNCNAPGPSLRLISVLLPLDKQLELGRRPIVSAGHGRRLTFVRRECREHLICIVRIRHVGVVVKFHVETVLLPDFSLKNAQSVRSHC